jgi:hypothetical protein
VRSEIAWGVGSLHLLLLWIHHCSVDLLSISNLLSELSSFLGQAECAPNLPDLSVQYLDFVNWERHCASQGLFDLPPGAKMRELRMQAAHVLHLPLDMPRPRVNTFRGCGVSAYISREDVQRLESWAGQNRGSTFGAILGAFLMLMCSWSAQEDMVVGSPHHGRDQPGLAPLIGSFMNILPISANVPRGELAPAVLAQAQKRFRSALQY